MAGNGDGEHVGGTGACHGAHGRRRTDPLCDVGIGDGLPDRNRAQHLPDPLLERRAADIEIERRVADPGVDQRRHPLQLAVQRRRLEAGAGKDTGQLCRQRIRLVIQQDGAQSAITAGHQYGPQRAAAHGMAQRAAYRLMTKVQSG